MPLTDTEFVEYCDRLGFTSRTIEIIRNIRNSPPSRRVGGGRDNVCGAYSSSKNGFGVQFESHTVEFPLVYKLEHDPDVLMYFCQPPAIQLQYLGPSGKLVVVWHTPDYFVLRRNSAGWEEAKHKDKLPDLAAASPNRYRLVGDRWESPAGQEYAQPLSLYYHVHSSAYVDPTFVRNAQFLDDYWRAPAEVSSTNTDTILNCLIRTPVMTLDHLLEQTKDSVPEDDVYKLLAKRIIHFDWNAAPLVEPERVYVFADEGSALQFHAATNGDRMQTGLFNLRANGQLNWDGKPWKILNVGQKNISLLGEGTEFIDLPSSVVEDLIRQGRLLHSAGHEQSEEEHPEVQRLISQASTKDLAIANRRAEFVQSYRNGDLCRNPGALTRSERRHVSQFEHASETYGNGYVGLLPRTRLRGNRTPQMSEEMQKALMNSIEKEYEVASQPSIYSCWIALKKSREAQGLSVPSYKTYCKHVRKRPRNNQIRSRKGRRAAYSESEFYWTLDRETPRHGDRPFEIGHIDHTELDLEFVGRISGRNIRRVWLTLLTDAYSRRVLAFYLTFDEPSYRSCMMVLRECVRIHQRLPQIIVVDNGPEFRSTYFESVIFRYEKTKKSRPSAHPRAGSTCERMFGTTNTQFIYNLRGNTQITKNVRQVTKSNNPQNLAVWDFQSFHEALAEYLYDVYDTMSHKALGMSPRDAYLLGIRGARTESIIKYNQDFLMTTAPSTRKGTAQVWPGRGVTINYFPYWSEAFRDPRIEKTNVRVRYDPWDAAVAWAYVNGHWVVCHSRYHSILQGRSEKEIKIASDLLRDQMRLHGEHRLTINASKLASFLENTKQSEALLMQRERDLESQCARSRGGMAENALEIDSPIVHVRDGAHTGASVSTTKPKRKIVIFGDL